MQQQPTPHPQPRRPQHPYPLQRQSATVGHPSAAATTAAAAAAAAQPNTTTPPGVQHDGAKAGVTEPTTGPVCVEPKLAPSAIPRPSCRLTPNRRGLVNLGNTCYANTTLQCLLHCLPLTMFFVQRTFEKHIGANAKKHEEAVTNRVVGQSVRTHPTAGTPSLMCLKMYALFLKEMCSTEKVTPHNPKDLFLLFSKASWCRNQAGETTSVFALGQQHDMVEFLQFVLDIIHDTAFCRVHVDIKGAVCGRMDQMLVQSYKQFGRHCEKQYSFVSDMMTGQYFTQNQTCDNQTPTEHSETYDPFTVFTLPIPVGVRQCTMYDCLDMLIQPEIIEGWKGELTDRERMIERKTYLWRLPQILVVHLKRFVNRYVKNECQVKVETRLDLSNHCLSNDSEHAMYNLFAVGNHEGSFNFGHYFADCLNSQMQWNRFNDSHVTPIRSSDIDGQKAYVLFYYRENAQSETNSSVVK